MDKEYRIVPNTNNRYLATRDGHIYDTKLNKYVAENKHPRGWLRCHIWYNDKRITTGVHRVIAYAWLGVSELTVNHKDGNKANNFVENLEWCTVKENNLHRYNVLNKKQTSNKKVGMFDKNTYELIKSFDSIEAAAQFFGKSRVNIDNAIQHKKD